MNLKTFFHTAWTILRAGMVIFLWGAVMSGLVYLCRYNALTILIGLFLAVTITVSAIYARR